MHVSGCIGVCVCFLSSEQESCVMNLDVPPPTLTLRATAVLHGQLLNEKMKE